MSMFRAIPEANDKVVYAIPYTLKWENILILMSDESNHFDGKPILDAVVTSCRWAITVIDDIYYTLRQRVSPSCTRYILMV